MMNNLSTTIKKSNGLDVMCKIFNNFKNYMKIILIFTKIYKISFNIKILKKLIKIKFLLINIYDNFYLYNY